MHQTFDIPNLANGSAITFDSCPESNIFLWFIVLIPSIGVPIEISKHVRLYSFEKPLFLFGEPEFWHSECWGKHNQNCFISIFEVKFFTNHMFNFFPQSSQRKALHLQRKVRFKIVYSETWICYLIVWRRFQNVLIILIIINLHMLDSFC